MLVVSACGPSNVTPTPPPSVANPTQSVQAVSPPGPSPLTSPAAGSSAQSAAVDAAVRDAAGRLGLASGASEVRVQQVEARDWPDAALGCPTQGEMYAQVVTPGFLVIVNGAGRELEYHADTRGRVILCSQV